MREASLRTITIFRETPPPAASFPGGRDREDSAGERLDDAELMMQVRAGSVRAFEIVLHRHWPATVRYARHLTRDADDAADMAQETFARLWERRHEWEARGSVLVWLLRTARHLVVSDARRRSVRARWSAGAGREERVRPATPLQEMERTELRGAIQRAVQQLSPRRCEVFTLFHVQNLGYREIAEIMEIRPQSVANYLHAAIAELRHALGPFLHAHAANDPREY
jgi:RNA polymerase sigma-70 factor, ECF subfamily